MIEAKNLNNFWIIKTNQMWKIWIFAILMFLGGCAFLGMIMTINGVLIPNRAGEIEFSLISMSLVFGSLIWFSKSLKCPKCGYKPTWPILKSAPASEWFVRITKLECCPGCGE